MAWATPPTFSSGAVLTAAQLNILSNNHLECGAATVTTAGDIVVADGANSLGTRLAHPGAGYLLGSDASNGLAWRKPTQDADTASNTSTTASYSDLGDAGTWNFASDIEVSVTTNTEALVWWRATLANNTGGAFTYLGFRVSGATTLAANLTSRGVRHEAGAANDTDTLTGFNLQASLTAGTNTFTLQAYVNTGTGTVTSPQILVIPL